MASDGTKEVSHMTFVSPSASYESCKNTQEHQLPFSSQNSLYLSLNHGYNTFQILIKEELQIHGHYKRKEKDDQQLPNFSFCFCLPLSCTSQDGASPSFPTIIMSHIMTRRVGEGKKVKDSKKESEMGNQSNTYIILCTYNDVVFILPINTSIYIYKFM